MVFLHRWQLSFCPRPVSAYSTSALRHSQAHWPQPSCILTNISNTISHPWLSGCTRNQFVTNPGWWLHYPKAKRRCEHEVIFVKSGSRIQPDRNCMDCLYWIYSEQGFLNLNVVFSLSLWKTDMSNTQNSQGNTAAKRKAHRNVKHPSTGSYGEIGHT